MERIVRERREERKRIIERVERFAECAKKKIGAITAILYGSYARGDFNEWSDVDVLIIVRGGLPRSPLERLNLLESCIDLLPVVEPVIVTLDELARLLEKSNPVALEALSHGVIIIDNLGLARRFKRITASREPA